MERIIITNKQARAMAGLLPYAANGISTHIPGEEIVIMGNLLIDLWVQSGFVSGIKKL